MSVTQIAADLSFSVTIPAPDGPDRTVKGSLRGERSTLELRLDETAALTSGNALQLARGVSSALGAAGVTVRVLGPKGPLVDLGAVRSSWMQRRLTGSRNMRAHAVLELLRLRRAGAARSEVPALPLLPPMTPVPLAPTFRRMRRRPVTTTHDPEGGGRPRLVFAPGPAPWPGDRQRVFDLDRPVTRIGSAPDADLRLDGIAAEHAEIHRTADDELVLVQLSGVGASLLNGERVLPPHLADDRARRHLLRTGARLQLGRWTMSYYREEYADHGRPYGGRVGGEIGRQRPQPPRRTVTDGPSF